MGQFALGKKPYQCVFFNKNCTSEVPHNITLFIEFEIIIVPESTCGLFIDQRSKVLPVAVIPCVCFGTPHLHISVFSLAFKSESARTKPRCSCPSSSGILIGVFSRKPVIKVCVCITVLEPEAESACHDLHHVWSRQNVIR